MTSSPCIVCNRCKNWICTQYYSEKYTFFYTWLTNANDRGFQNKPLPNGIKWILRKVPDLTLPLGIHVSYNVPIWAPTPIATATSTHRRQWLDFSFDLAHVQTRNCEVFIELTRSIHMRLLKHGNEKYTFSQQRFTAPVNLQNGFILISETKRISLLIQMGIHSSMQDLQPGRPTYFQRLRSLRTGPGRPTKLYNHARLLSPVVYRHENTSWCITTATHCIM